ncbi:PDZ domain-containing protein [Myroides odoratus]
MKSINVQCPSGKTTRYKLISNRFFLAMITVFLIVLLINYHSSSSSKSRRDWGAKFCLNESKQVEVCFIWDGSELAQVGIKIGDQVTSINDQMINHLTYAEFCELTASLKKLNKATFGFKNTKTEKFVELNKNN